MKSNSYLRTAYLHIVLSTYKVKNIRYLNNETLPSQRCINCDKMLPIVGNAIKLTMYNDKYFGFEYIYYCSIECMVAGML